MERFLTDKQWAFILPLLLPQKPKGRKRADDRQTLEPWKGFYGSS